MCRSSAREHRRETKIGRQLGLDGSHRHAGQDRPAGLVDSKVKARLNELGATTMPGSPADFSELIARETDRWGKVIRSSGFKVSVREK
jgi:hypothetical protein